MPKLLASKEPRITNITSNGHALSPFRFADYNFGFDEKEAESLLPRDQRPDKTKCEVFGVPWGLTYLPHIAYGQSKTAMILYTRELAVRLKHKNVTATCCNPGAVATDLWRELPEEVRASIFKAFPMKSESQGVATPLVAALDPKLASDGNGAYLDDCQVQDPEDWASDAGKAKDLWDLSEKIVGESFSW